ncbi:MAG: YifB family Mg chelatase-like AAA ATPase [Candidatus Gastranaerophilales bacterium]|nr:YifB family Mg chelatase-like AAA ATPase [Candidatus Gastranaerophilales bacterium]
MVSRIYTGVLSGLNTHKVVAEVDMNNSLPCVVIVGLPDAAVSEAKERVRSAIKNSGYAFPPKKITVNLAPADIRKEGSLYDLPIAVGILSLDGVVNSEKTEDYAFIGELSLDGSLRGVTGVLPLVSGLKDLGFKKIIVPFENVKEAALISDIDVFGAKHLVDVVNHFSDNPEEHKPLKKTVIDINEYMKVEKSKFDFDFKDVKGQLKAKKAMEIAAAGGHNVLMSGSPGSGKTLLAKCFSSILPPPTPQEAIELTKIYSVAGLIDKEHPLITKRPFRTVHHTASAIGIIGGGSNPKPGEITLAHRGVLFFDEIVEFPRNVLEVLRQPLEDSEIVISRVQTSIKYPADFIFIGAMNPCPCGYLGDKEKECTCSEFQIQRYRAKISGPLLDRIDIQIEVPRLKAEELIDKNFKSESSEEIRSRVIHAREVQYNRYKNEDILTNSELTPSLIKIYCKLDEASENILKMAGKKFNISGRGYDRILKLARTIADLDSSADIKTAHVSQALQYRNFVENK